MKVLYYLVQLLVTFSVLYPHGTVALEPISILASIIVTATGVQKLTEFTKWASNTVQLVDKGDTKFDLFADEESELLGGFKRITDQINQLEQQYSPYIAVATDAVHSSVRQNVPLILKFDEIMDIMNRISSRYQQMLRYEVYKDKLEVNTLLTFAEWAISPNAFSVSHLMERLHLTLFHNGKHTLRSSASENILSLLAHNYGESHEMCQTQQSVQQFVYSLYTDIALTELKGYTIMEFSLATLRIFGQGNYTQEEELVRSDYMRRTERAINLVRMVMQAADRSVRRCDPAKHVSKVTYDEVTRLLQGYIVNEVDMHASGSCWLNCEHFRNSKIRDCYDNMFCAQQTKCSGELRNCQFIQSDMHVCLAPRSSYRRYEYVEYPGGHLVLGHRQSCGRGTSNVYSWWRWIFWHCSYCFCLCDEQSQKSDRFFNLRQTVSDVRQNKVVTGVRFVKHNRVFHLQIQQAKMLPLGVIDESSLGWKPVDSYGVYDRDVIRGVDYHVLNYSSRALDLDDIENTNKNSSVVTGVRFQLFNSHLNLMVQFTEFDFKTGQILQGESNTNWRYNGRYDRKQWKLDDLDIPTRSVAKSEPLSSHNQYLEFVNSGLVKDAAQTTVPFIDIQDVVAKPPVPLAGIGIYYKSFSGFGGYVAPKIISYDFSPHVQMPKTVT